MNRKIIIGIAILVASLAIGFVVYSQLNSDTRILNKQLDLGNKYLEEGNYEQAILAYQAVLDIDENNVEAYTGIAEAYEYFGEYDKAIALLNQGIERTSNLQLMLKLETIEELIKKTPANIQISHIDTSNYPEVSIYFSIFDENGTEIFEYDEALFKILERLENESDYHEQEVLSVKKLDLNEYSSISLVMDISDSMNENNNIYYAKMAADNFVKNITLNEKNMISVLSFNSEQNMLEDFTYNVAQVSNSINSLSAFGQTALYDSIYLSLLQINNRFGQKFILAFTDGEDTCSRYTKEDIIQLSRELGIPIYIIGIGYAPNVNALTSLTTESGGRYIPIENAQELNNIYMDIFNQQKNQLFLTYKTKHTDAKAIRRDLQINFENNEYESIFEDEYVPAKSISSQFISNAIINSVEASSYHTEIYTKESFYYVPENAIDGSYNTAWVEDASEHGINEWLKLNFTGEYTINGINLSNGYKKRRDLYYKNSRIKKIRIEFSDGSYYDMDLIDEFAYIDRITFAEPKVTSSVKLTILDVYPGSAYDDTCITDVSVF